MPNRASYIAIAMAVVFAGVASAQTLTEFGAAAAAGTTGGVAGKGVSNGINTIFGKVDQQTQAAAKAASQSKPAAPAPATAVAAPSPAASALATSASSGEAPAAPAAKTAPAKLAPAKPAPAKVARASSTVKRATPPSVPDPPALPSHAAATKAPEPPPAPEPAPEPVAVVPPPPPPPEATKDDLKAIAPGTPREELLKLGAPASRMTMFGDEGQLLEIYRYMTNGVTFGIVRLSDGTVSTVELR